MKVQKPPNPYRYEETRLRMQAREAGKIAIRDLADPKFKPRRPFFQGKRKVKITLPKLKFMEP